MQNDLLTLTEAAKISGRSREALRLRVRRGKMEGLKGNDGLIRLWRHEVEQLPPSDHPQDEVDGVDEAGSEMTALWELSTMLKADLGQTRTELDQTRVDLEQTRSALAETRVEAAKAEARTALLERMLQKAEARVAEAEAALVEARKPWIRRVLGL